jgi:hypothetical protein
VICQIVVQEEYRKAVVSLAHDSSMTENLGVNETSNGILAHFYWPNIRPVDLVTSAELFGNRIKTFV